MLKVMLLLAMVVGSAVQGPAGSRYAEGQVWEYRTRPGEEGSLLKIQRVELPPGTGPGAEIYHISIIGLHLNGQTELQHAPVSREALDASVTRLSDSRVAFPDVMQGISEWREARGGVFTIPVAQIAQIVDQAIRRASLGQ